MNNFKKVTVLFDVVTEFIQYDDGFLIDEHTAVIEEENGTVLMVEVQPTDCPDVFKQSGGSMVIGNTGGKDVVPLVVSFIAKMKRMSAYDFFRNTVVKMNDDIQFDLI